MKIYTRKGDDGTTSLWYGGRVAKTDARTEAYGSIDEADATLGAARSLCGPDDTELAADLLSLQRQLFVAGAELATAPEAAGRLEDGVSRVTDAMVEALEPTIDRYMDRVDLPPKFVIPGGTRLSAQLDVARATLRRAERRVVTLKEADGLASEAVLRFLNRASDLVFAMARFADLDESGAVRGPRQGGERWLGRPLAAARATPTTSRSQGGHRLVIDEPEESGGANQGPSPTRTLAGTLAACTAITMEMYADRKGWDVGALEVGVEMEYAQSSVPRSFVVILRLPTALTEEQVERLKVIAGKCPVHRALRHDTEVYRSGRPGRALSRPWTSSSTARHARSPAPAAGSAARSPAALRGGRQRVVVARTAGARGRGAAELSAKRAAQPGLAPRRHRAGRRRADRRRRHGELRPARRPGQQRRHRNAPPPRSGSRRRLAGRLGAERDGAAAGDGRGGPGMAARGWGRIVNVCSSAAKRPSGMTPEYSVTKAAELSLSRVFADAYAKRRRPGERDLPRSHQVGAVDGARRPPRPVRRARRWRSRDEALAAAGAGRPIGRLAEVEEIADAIVFLCSQRASYVAGAAWSVDGGTVQVII